MGETCSFLTEEGGSGRVKTCSFLPSDLVLCTCYVRGVEIVLFHSPDHVGLLKSYAQPQRLHLMHIFPG